MALLRAWISLVLLSLRRLLWSANTLMVLVPLAGCALFVARRDYADVDSARAFDQFSSEFVTFVFALFVVPICSLAYGATSVGGDREERTLVFLLVRPIPRPLVLLAKLAASFPVALLMVLGSYWFYCWLAGDVGTLAWKLFLRPIVCMTVAYVCLFQFFAVAFRYSTILALVYSLFIEVMIGNLPGIIKRVTVNYYGRSMIYGLGEPRGLKPPDADWFEPLPVAEAGWTLLGVAAFFLLLALAVFWRREYRDLT